MTRTAQIFLLVLVVTLIWLPPQAFMVKVVKPFLPDDMQQALAMEEKARTLGRECQFVGQCGDVIRIQCRPDIEAIFTYINLTDDSVIAECRDCCEENLCLDGECPANCPPVEWNCNAENAIQPEQD